MSSSTFCIAVVDNDQDDLLLFKRALCETGVSAELLVATNGIELLGILAKERIVPHAIFLNINMPLTDILTSLERLRADTYRGPIIILSTLEYLQAQSQAYQRGATLFLRKPNQYSDYLHILSTLLKENYNWLSQLKSLKRP